MTHHWDEIEYFELALPHALKEEKVAGVKAGCNGCHAPLALLAGDIPPKKPAENSRANEGVSCDVCHSIPSGSAEERVVWLHVEAIDAAGQRHHLAVDAKGFEGESFTVASADALAYQDIGDIKGLEDFPGLKRDGQVPAGDRIFRLPYLDPQGRMTVAQWNTATFGPDYRLEPLAAKIETFTWNLPKDMAPGPVEVTAEVWYSKLVSSVADYLKVPAEESEAVRMGVHSTQFTVVEG